MCTTYLRTDLILASVIAMAFLGNLLVAQDVEDEPTDQADVEALIRDLDAEDYQTREDATNALIQQGKSVTERLEELAKDPPSAEVKVRLQKVFRGIELAELRSNAVKLDQLFDLVRRANNDDLDRETLAPLLAQLSHVIVDATGEDKWTLPVSFDDVNREEPATSVQGGLVIAHRAKITSVQDSIVLADVAAEITSARNSIIIARAAVNISSPRNCIVIAGYDARVSSARDSILISGNTMNASIARDCVLAAAEPLSISVAEQCTLINSELARRPSREPPKMLESEGFVYPEAVKENPLNEKIQVTYASGDVVLFKRAAGGGELVARLDKPISHPDGGAIEELIGWQACYTGRSGYAIFRKGDQLVTLPVVAP